MAWYKEDKYIHLVNVLCCRNFEIVQKSTLSPWIDYLCVVTQQNDALLYSLPSSENNIKPLWQCPSKVQSCLFSEDGKNILMVLKVNSIQIYTIKDKKITLLWQIKALELINLFQTYNIDFSAACFLNPLNLKKDRMIFMVNKKLLISVEWSLIKPPTLTYSIPIILYKDIFLSEKYAFVLNNVGCINVYHILTGENVCPEINVSSISSGKETFFKLVVHSDLLIMALVNQVEEIVLFDIHELFKAKQKTNKISDDTRKDKWTWSYKISKTRQNSSKVSNVLKFCGRVSPPSGLVVAFLQFSIKGLFAFYGILGQSKCCSFKVIEESSGVILYNFEGLTESTVVTGGHLPLVMTDSNLFLCLGALCTDYFIVKLCSIIADFEFSKELELTLMSQNWKGPMKFHHVFLKIIHLWHMNLFSTSLKTLSSQEVENNNQAIHAVKTDFSEQIILNKICDLFKIILELECDETTIDLDKKESMIVTSLLHALCLLDMTQMVQTEIFGFNLFSTLLKQILLLYGKIKISDPLQKDWLGWLEMTDDAIIQEAIMVGAVGLAHVFLVTNRHWPADEVENKFKVKAQAWITELIMMSELKKADMALRNLGYNPLKKMKNICLETDNRLLRDILITYLNELGKCTSDEMKAWAFIKEIENALFSNVKRHHVFDRKMNVSAAQNNKLVSYKWPSYHGSIDLATLLEWSEEWRDAVLTEVYFNTGDITLEKNLKKESCWKFLLDTNQQDFLKNWIDIANNPDILHSLNKTSDYFMKNFYNLFTEWPVTESMVNGIDDAECMDSTKAVVLNTCILYGFFVSYEKHSLKKIIYRLENQSLLSQTYTILTKPTSNLSPNEFEEMIFRKCLSCSLKPVILTCLEKPILLTESSTLIKESVWINAWRKFFSANAEFKKNSNFKDFIIQSLQLYDCSAKDRSLLDAAIALLDEREISNIIENEGEHCSLLQLPLINADWKTIYGSNESNPDVTLYDLLGSSKLPVHNLFLWQSQNKVETTPTTQEIFFEFPHFNHQVLGIKHGFKQSLDHIYYLKQGRPSFACNLFVVESLRIQRRLTTKMIKKACGLAHGLALRCWKNNSVGNASIAFIAMLGDIAAANILRIHLGVIQCICNHLHPDMRHYISTLARGILKRDLMCIQEVSSLLESSIMACWEKEKPVASLKQWYLAVAFCNIHSLPLPTLLLKHLARNHDWFSFVVCLDIFKYPYEQAIELIEEINSKILKSHLIRAVTRTTLKLSTTSPNKSPPKILLEPESNGKEDQEMAATKDVKDVFQTFVTNIYTEVLNTIQTFTDKNIVLPWSCEQDPDSDVLLTLLKCESEPDTSKSLLTSSIELQSPILSVLATCFQSQNIFLNMIAWLVSSIPTSMSRMKRREEGQQLISRNYGSKETETLLVNFFSTGYFQTLYRGMNLFMSENPITLFMNAVYHSIVLLNFDIALDLLKEFVLEVAHFPPQECSATSKSSILSIVAQCIGNLLTRPDLQNSIKRRFLRILAKSELSALDAGFPNYLLWSQICEILECSDVNLDFMRLYDITLISEELQNCLDTLIKNFHFTQALEICSLLSLNKDQFVLAMWKHQLNISLQMEPSAIKIWKDSSLAFKDENVNPNLAAIFYHDMASDFISPSKESLKNKYFALKYCLHWRRLVEDTQSVSFKEESDAIELKKWKCCIQPNFDFAILKNQDSFDASQTLLNNIWSSTKVLVRSEILEESQKKRVEELINVFLELGDLQKALRIDAFFKSDNEDLILIKSCLTISQAETCIPDVYKLDALTSNIASKKHWLQFQPAKELDLSDFEIPPSKEQRRVLFTLNKLCQAVKHGKYLAKKILICYRLSISLDMTFQDIFSEPDYLSNLSRFLSHIKGINQFSVASDLITLAHLTHDELARFLKDKIVSALMEFHSSDLLVPVKLWNLSLDSDFHLIINLSNNPSLLGLELLQASTNLPCSHAVEVLIKAHSCFAATCNVEGIGRVLRRARILASQALQAGQWQYLVRLLVGIERYSDMSYIFQMLKDNGQFEQLLRKGLHKVPGLHMAISEFLQRYCPQDRELSKMVAAYFGLHSKLATLWLKEADEIIMEISVTDNILRDTSKTRQVLNLASENYSHAAHWFLQGGKLNRALKVAHRAQLVALQISLLGGPFILKLQTPAELQTLVNKSLSVAQTLLISRAYEIDPDWVAALHERWILKGDKIFFSDLKSSYILSSQLIRNYLLRYNIETTLNSKAKERMKQLISNSKIPSPLSNDLKTS